MRPGFHRFWMSIVLVIVLAFGLVYLAADASKLSSLVRISDMWSLVLLNPDRPGVFTEIDPHDFASPPIPQRGDTLLTVNGLRATQGNYFTVFSPRTPRGLRVPIQFLRGKDHFETVVVTRTIPAIFKAQFVTLYCLRVLLTLGLIFIGFWAFLRRAEVPAVRTLALFCYTTAISQLVYVQAAPDPYATFQIPWRGVFLTAGTLIGGFSPILWLRLSFQFPTPQTWYEHRLRERRWLLVIGLLAALVVLLFTARLARIHVPAAVLVSCGLACILGGFLVLWRSYGKTRDTLTRKQLRLVLFGAIPAMIMTGASSILALRAGQMSNLTRLYILNLNCLALLFVPITFGYAFGRYRLLEIEGRLRRGTRFAAVNVLVILAFIGLLYSFGSFILGRLDIETRGATFTMGLVLALAFAPTQRRLRRFLERRFYPERLRLAGLLREFLETASRRLEPERFWSELQRKLSEGLRAESVGVFLRTRDGSFVEPGDMREPYPEPPPGCWGKFDWLDYPIPFDELIGSGRLTLTEPERRWAETCRIAVVVPLQGSTQRVGYLLLGPKAEQEDYSAHELDLLRSLATQIGLTAENLQLLGDRLERQRLEEELGFARRIQEGLLPTVLSFPGLEIAARIRFCLEVAGDFYDVVPMRDGRILLAVGDVAGKGVGAALLMANVQASLRAMKDTGLRLSETVAEINSLVFQNTPDYLFITLFVAMYDPQTRELVYVNAGHNPPIFYPLGGPAKSLDEGGLVLGVTPAVLYEQGVVHLQPGDLLLMYTDGVTEARGGVDDEFGEGRLVRMLPALSAAPLESALDSIEGEVRLFTGRDEMDDDFTLLVVRVPAEPAGDAGTEHAVITARSE
jgi:serine phosphatase RsbU (regulator of sigma subunit)